MTRDNAAIGRKSQALGDALESWLNTQHEMAMRLGILAHIEKTQARTRVHKGRLEYEAKGVADFVGCLEGVYNKEILDGPFREYRVAAGLPAAHLPAQYLALEAKSIGMDYLPRAEISKLQQDHLDAVARAGGLALLVVEFRIEAPTRVGLIERERVAIEWLRVPWKVKKSAESVSLVDVLDWCVVSPCYLFRWHAGGPRSSVSGGAKRRIYARE